MDQILNVYTISIYLTGYFTTVGILLIADHFLNDRYNFAFNFIMSLFWPIGMTIFITLILPGHLINELWKSRPIKYIRSIPSKLQSYHPEQRKKIETQNGEVSLYNNQNGQLSIGE